MLKYAKIIDDRAKTCMVAIGTNEKYYLKNGFSLQNVEQAQAGDWYISGYVPKKESEDETEIENV